MRPVRRQRKEFREKVMVPEKVEVAGFEGPWRGLYRLGYCETLEWRDELGRYPLGEGREL